jgi:hypothetical protein
VLYVGQEPLRMKSELTAGENLVFRYRLIDIREFDGDQLIESSRIGDNVIAILARLRDNRQAVHEILARLARLEPGPREFYLRAPLILAGLRKLGTVIEEEAISRRTASRGKCRRQHRQ